MFSKPGGGTRVGERLSELPLTLRSDPAEPGLESAPFVIAHSSGDDASVFDNGLPRRRHRLDRATGVLQPADRPPGTAPG